MFIAIVCVYVYAVYVIVALWWLFCTWSC